MEKWEKWIIPLIYLVAAYLLEFTRPWVVSYFKKRSLSVKERRKYILINRYKEIKKFRENPVFTSKLPLPFRLAIYISLFLVVVIFLREFFISILGDFYTPLFFVISSLSVIYLTVLVLRDLKRMKDFVLFDSYRARVIKELVKLGGNPEDLNKEETE